MVLGLDISEVNISLFRLVNDLGKEHPFLNPVFSFIAEYMVFLLALMFFLFGLQEIRIIEL